MEVLIFTNSSLFVKTVSSIGNAYKVVGIVISNKTNPDLLSTIDYARLRQIPLLAISNEDLQQVGRVDEWISSLGCKMAFVMTFPFKIPERILGIPEKGFYNVHYSQLPAYKGPDPLFWQLKNGLKSVGLTIHKMTSKMDDGPPVFSQEMILMLGENYGLAAARLTLLLAQHLDQIFQNILKGEYIAPESMVQASYFKRPDADNLTINWEKQSAEEIENLVNASNPRYNGARTYLGGQLLGVLEVSGVDGSFEPGTIVPGTVFHVDPLHGPMVLTVDKQLLLINVVETEHGIFSGKKWCAMGIKKGDRFLNLN